MPATPPTSLKCKLYGRAATASLSAIDGPMEKKLSAFLLGMNEVLKEQNLNIVLTKKFRLLNLRKVV